MPSITGIELAPDSCVLTRVRPLSGGMEISALHLIERGASPGHGVGGALREVRRRKGFPRRACVVAWGLREPAGLDQPHVRARLKPVIAAGFHVERVLTPPQGLAALATTRPRTPGAGVVWLSLNTHGVAIAIVRDGELLFSRTFGWTLSTQPSGPHAEMLQRYSRVAHLAPEVHRGIALVAQTHQITVESAVTCGDLPDLRSLTMPLIEELDLEVETLDSTEGLVSTGGARTDRFAETAPALRLAAAAAFSARSSNKTKSVAPLLGAAAAIAIVATAGWAGHRYWFQAAVRPVTQRLSVSPAPRQAALTQSMPVVTPLAQSIITPTPVETQTVETKPVAPSPAVAPNPSVQNPTVQNPTVSRIVPLKEALPAVESILISRDRRVAMVGGAIVSVGDSIGSRVVVSIDRTTVVLREPSGYELRTPLRSGAGAQ